MCAPSNSKTSSLRSSHSTRKKLWHLDKAYHCSIIGTCLSLAELKQITKKYQITTDGKMTDYKLHSIFVNSVSAASDPIRYIQKFLDKKYSSQIKRYAKARSLEEFEQLWSEALESGDVAGAFWAIVTNPHIDSNLLQRVTGEVHMLSHISGASTRNDIKVVGKLRAQKQMANEAHSKTTSSMAAQLRQKESDIRSLNKEIRYYKAQMKALEIAKQKLDIIEKEGGLAQLESLGKQLEVTALRAQQAEQHSSGLEIKLKQFAQNNEHLQQELVIHRAEKQAVESTLNRLLSDHCNKSCELSETEECPLRNLTGLNILYVGGRASQCSFFRALVEQCHGAFLYHDGGKEESQSKLNSLLAQADAVLCPTDCVSHDAYYRVKRHCESQTKQLIMIPHASLSSFTKGLEEVMI